MRTCMDMVVVALAIVVGFSFPGAAEAGVVDGIPNNVLWLDASDPATVIQTTNPGFVEQWSDKSTVGTNHFTQGNVAYKPATGGASLYGKNVLTLDGSNDHLLGPAVLAGNDDDYTYFVVWRPHKNTGVQTPYEQAGPGVGARSSILAVNNKYGFNGQNRDRHDLVPFGPNQWRLTAMTVDDTVAPNINIWDNGTHFSGTTTGGIGSLNVGTSGSTVAKKQLVFSEFLDGDIAEIIVYDRGLTTAELNTVGNYLTRKYGLQSSYSGLPVHRWSFNDGTANDQMGTAHGTLFGNATVAGGQLALDGSGDYMTTSPIDVHIKEKTLVAWVSLNNLGQPGGAGVLGLDNNNGTVPGTIFDSIVYQERTAGQWMNGSNFWQRTPANNGGPAETLTTEVMLAIVYGSDNSISIYRDGVPYGVPYTQGTLQWYLDGSAVAVLGRRTVIAGPELDGFINEARIYNYALSRQDVLGLYLAGPNQLIYPEPTTLTLLALGGGLAALRRRRRAKA